MTAVGVNALTEILRRERSERMGYERDNERLNAAIRFAVNHHAGQLRKGTTHPYIVHPMEVMSILMRMDADTVSASNNHEKMFSQFVKQKIPILIGTQMVAKGLDFENVTLVGVIAADLSLYVDDFRAGERTFSLITQAIGRAGRGAKSGRAVIQTWTPENEVITCAAAQDYDSFYEQEISMRKLRGCPPFRDLFLLTASGADEHGVLRACMRLRQALESAVLQPPYNQLQIQILGPAPASVTKINNRYRYRVTVSGKNSKEMRALLAHLVRSAQQDKENRGISVFADVNPLD